MSRFLDPELASLAPYVPGEQPRAVNGLIKLNTNENPYPPSPKVLDALSPQSLARLPLYPDPGCLGLKEAVARAYGLSPDQIFVGNGSDEVLAFIFRGHCAQGAAGADIGYGFYPVFAALFQRPWRTLPLREDFSLNINDYAGIKTPLIIANPNAPTGLALSLSQVRDLLEQDRRRLLVLDEAYVDFGADTALGLINSFDNLLIVQTLSKSRQLAGARLGLALGQAELIADLERIKFSFNPYSVNRLALAAGEAAFEDEEWFQHCRQAVMEERRRMAEELGLLGFTLTDSRANFIFAAPPTGLSGQEYYLALREAHILIRWFDKDRIRNHVRISAGLPEQTTALLQATRAILRERNLL